MKIEIREDFRKLIPPLTPAELAQLHKSLKEYGQARDPLVIWAEAGVLLDGHNRYEYCNAHNLKFDAVEVSCVTEDDAKNWIILNQLGRRNLSPGAASNLRGKLYNSRKKTQGGDHGNQHTAKGKSCTLPDSTAAQVAKETGVSERTVKNDAKFAEAVEKLGIEDAVLAGTEKRSRKEIVEAASPKQPKEPQPLITDFDKRIKREREECMRVAKEAIKVLRTMPKNFTGRQEAINHVVIWLQKNG